jgi:hypothetical protein
MNATTKNEKQDQQGKAALNERNTNTTTGPPTRKPVGHQTKSTLTVLYIVLFQNNKLI